MKLKVGIIGGSGYTGIELLRLLHQHPGAEVHAITSRALQGKKLYEVFPNMHGMSDLSYLLPDDEKLFEFLILEGAQAGLSWTTILNRRDGYRKAFSNFDAKKVSKYTQKHIEKLENA